MQQRRRNLEQKNRIIWTRYQSSQVRRQHLLRETDLDKAEMENIERLHEFIQEETATIDKEIERISLRMQREWDLMVTAGWRLDVRRMARPMNVLEIPEELYEN